MESLVYIHLASAFEANSTINSSASPIEAQAYQRPNLKQVYKKVFIHLLSILLAATSLGVASQAMAAMRQGSKGLEVTQLQQQLKQLGYFNRRATGNFGPLTKAAVMRFQENEGLNPNGVVDEETQAALENRLGSETQNSENNTNTPTQSISSRPTLRKGDRSEAVKSLQQILTKTGAYDGQINGVFDAETLKAVKQFQRSSGLGVDGIVGKKTWTALIDGDTTNANQPFDNTPFTNDSSFTESSGQRIGTPVLRQGDKGEDVSNLQQRLQELGYFRSRITGNFGPVTKAAVTRFQRDKGLRANGIADGKTQAALDGSGSSNNNLNVSELQQRLKEKGFYQGPIDGRYNEQTKAAVKAAQREYGISENDILKNEF